MKNIVLKLAGKGKDELFEGVKSLPGYNVAAFTDRKISLWDTQEQGIKVCSVYDVVGMYSQGTVDAVLMDGTLKLELLERLANELIALGMKGQDILVAVPEFYEDPGSHNIRAFQDYHCLPYIEYHVVDHCNLNCRGCVHFSPLVEGEEFAEYEQVESDLCQLKKLVPYIEEIHILGGEPLLNKELWRYLELTRRVYPYAQIWVVTNGLLLKAMDERLVSSMKENDVGIVVSLYEPMYGTIQQTMEEVNARGLRIVVTEAIDKFAYAFDERGGHLSGVQRINCKCPNLYKGKLSLCPMIAYMDYFERAFGKETNVEHGRIDIYDPKLTFKKLQERLGTPIDVCDNCMFVSAEDAVSMKWMQAGQIKYEDYVKQY